MDLLQEFISFLQSQKKRSSKLTIKNYKSDIRQFFNWFETEFKKPFLPPLATKEIILAYTKSRSSLSHRSLQRHLSSLRKFFDFLKIEGVISTSPLLPASQKPSSQNQDEWKIKEFKDYLYIYNLSNISIKNYIIDIRQFLRWCEEVTGVKQTWNLKDKNIFDKINVALIEEYKDRLLRQAQYCPTSINRKLSSLRKYLSWLSDQKLLKNNVEFSFQLPKKQPFSQNKIYQKEQFDTLRYESEAYQKIQEAPQTEHINQTDLNLEQTRQYSRFPPFRLAQKIIRLTGITFDTFLIAPLVEMIQEADYLKWFLNGKKIFSSPKKIEPSVEVKIPVVKNIKKEFYAPLLISTKYFPLHKKIYHYLRHKRPEWYKKYHSYTISHYLNTAVLIIVASAIGFSFYNAFIKIPSRQRGVFAGPAAPARILSFQGRLTDSVDNPITAPTDLRFGIYSNETASGSALVWQEVNRVTPDSSGVFSILLGKGTTIAQSIFGEHTSLWLGVTVKTDSELKPRQQVATVAYAANADVLQGLPPITQGGTANVILALDSSGNLTIGGSATPTFQATGGQFKISGQPLLLTTNSGSNSNVLVSPDGIGKVDFQKPVLNSTNNNNISTAVGSVEIDDLLSVLATSSGQSAFTINQNDSGPLISASASGVAKFTIGNDGAGYFAGNVGIATASPSQKLEVSGNIYANAGQIRIGNFSSGPTTIGAGSLYYDTTSARPFYSNGTSWLTLDSNWTIANGAIRPNQATVLDLLLGADATTSAKFAVLNINSGTPTASLSANSGNNATYINGTGTLSTTNAQTLTLGGSTTGNIVIDSGSSAITLSDNLTLLGTTITGTSLTTITGGATAIDFTEFDVSATTGSVTINDGGDLGNISVEGTILDINSLDFVGTGSITTGGSNTLTLDAGNNVITFASTDTTLTATGLDTITSAATLGVSATTLNLGGGAAATIGTVSDDSLTITPNGTGELTLTSDFDTGVNIGASTNTQAPLSISGGIGSNASLIVNNTNSGDLFTASASGTTRFRITNGGNLASIAGSNWLPISDSTTALNIANAAATAFVTFDTSNTRVGIGTTAPSFKLDVQDSQTSTAAAMINNTNTGTDADGLIVKLGFTGAGNSSNHFVEFIDGSGRIQGSIQSNGANGITYAQNGIADFAEYFKKDEKEAISWGSVVCQAQDGLVRLCTKENGIIVGVASEHPAFLGGVELGEKSITVGLLGQIPVRVSSKNGSIQPGDALTSSDIPGVLVKAIQEGPVVGKALEKHEDMSPQNEGKILALVNPSWYNPDVYITESGDLSIAEKTQNDQAFLSQSGQSYPLQSEPSIVKLKTEEFIETLQDYIAATVSDILYTNYHILHTTLVSPLVEAEQINTHIISPLASDSDLIIKLASSSAADGSQLLIQNSSGSAVASIDSSGNASFSGTLRANKIIADEIEFPIINSISSPSATYITNVTNVYQTNATESAQPIQDQTQLSQNTQLQTNSISRNSLSEELDLNQFNATNSSIFNTVSMDSASISALLAFLPHLKTDFATIEQGLVSFGPTSLSDVSVAGQISVGGSFILADNTINALGGALELQPLKQGGISFLNGLVSIDTDGNMKVTGNAEFARNINVKGILAANIIAPIPDSDLIIQLRGTTQNNKLNNTDDSVVPTGSALIIQNASGSAVAIIDQQGNLTASGAGRFKDILAKRFTLVREAQADTSLTETIASASAGTATIITGETYRTIINPHVSEKSLIYISPASNTQGLTPYIARQTAESEEQNTKGSFTIEIPERLYKDITVNWWIVN